jgi:hypothetical protein
LPEVPEVHRVKKSEVVFFVVALAIILAVGTVVINTISSLP